jgi:photosystem II stability/assembly factor-like uncharacterized protein
VVAVGTDPSGAVYVAGVTSSRDFPTVRAMQPASPSCPADLNYGCESGFLMRLDSGGSAVAFATYFGGTASTTVSGMSLDRFGNAYLIGSNRGNDLPIRRAPQPDNGASPLILSEDGGRTWVAPQGLRANTAGVAWSGGGRPTVYAGTDRGLFVSNDYGRRWTELTAMATRKVGVAVDPVTPNILYASVWPDGADSLHPGRPGGMFKSLDGGQSWTPINNGLSETSAVSSITIAPSQPSTLYITAYVRANYNYYVFASDDGGSTWRGGTAGATSIAVSPIDPRRVYAADRESGFNISTDGARTWRRTSPPLGGSGRRMGPIVVNPVRPSEVWVSHEDAIGRSLDSGETWEWFGRGDGEDAYSLSIDPLNPDDLWVARRSISRFGATSSSSGSVGGRFLYVNGVSAYGGRLLATAWPPTGFVAAFDPSGTMVWSTYLGGVGGYDIASGVSAAADRIYVTGGTNSEIWPLAQAGGRPFGGAGDVFLAGYLIPR